MKIVAHILSSASGLPSVLVATESSRMLFNVGEGVQRYCATHKLRLSKTSRIFLTDISPTACAGLPGNCGIPFHLNAFRQCTFLGLLAGMVLTLADVGLRDFSIIGGPGTSRYAYALRHFFSR